MISFFKNNLYFITLGVIVYIVVLRIFSFVSTTAYPILFSDSQLVDIIYRLIAGAWTQGILSTLLIVIHALMINHMVVKHRMNKESGLVSGAMYGLLTSMIFTHGIHLPPVLLANTFILLSIKQILKTYNQREVSAETYLSGFWGACAALLYSPYLYFFIITTIALVIMRSFTMKERLQHFTGWLTPYILLGAYQFLTDDASKSILSLFNDKISLLSFSSLGNYHLKEITTVALILVLTIFSLVNYNRYVGKKDISIVKRIDILFWLILYGGLTSCIFVNINASHLMTLTIGLSFLLAVSLSNMKNSILAEILHLFLIIGVVYLQYIN